MDHEILSLIDLKSCTKKAFSIGNRSHFAVLSIENDGFLNRQKTFYKLRSAFETIGISQICSYVVNELGHINVYLCFAEPFDSKELYPYIRDWLYTIGLEADVRLIDTGEPIEFPLQKDFAWINQDLHQIVKRQEMSIESAIAMFLADLNKGLIELDLFRLSIASLPDADDKSCEVNLSGQPGQEIIDFSPDSPSNGLAVLDFESTEGVQTESRQYIDDSETLPLEEDSKCQESATNSCLNSEESDFEVEESSTMLPPPGTKTFRQLTIPFGNEVKLTKDRWKGQRGPP